MDLSEVYKFEQQQRITKLSEAIRAGAKLRPQCIGAYTKEGGSCAYGAAAEALGMDPNAVHLGPFILAEQAFTRATKIGISHANDSGWTREQIAEELERLGY